MIHAERDVGLTVPGWTKDVSSFAQRDDDPWSSVCRRDAWHPATERNGAKKLPFMAGASMNPVDKTTVYLPDGLRTRLQAEARRRGTTQAVLIREAILAYLDKTPLPRPTSLGVVSDDRMEGRGARDWIRSQWDRNLDDQA